MPSRWTLIARRALRWTFAGVLLVALLGLGLMSTPMEEATRSALERALSRALGDPVTLGRLTLEPFQGRAEVEGLLVRHAEPDGQLRPVIVVDRLRAEVGLGWRGPRLRRVEIDGPFVDLHLDAGGLRELPGLRGSGEAEPAPPTGTGELPWEELELRGGSLRLTSADGAVRVEGLTIRPEAPGRQRLQADVLALSRGDFTEEARAIDLSGLEVSTRRVVIPDLRLPFTHLQVTGALAADLGGPLHGDLSLAADLAGLSPLLGGPHLQGQLVVDAELNGSPEAPVLVLAAAVDQLVLTTPLEGGADEIWPIGPVNAGLRLDGRLLTIDRAVLGWGGGLVEVAGLVDLEGGGLSMSVIGEGLSLYDALAHTQVSAGPWVELTVDPEIHVGGTIDPFQIAGSFDLAVTDLFVGSGDARARGMEPILTLPRATLRGELSVDATHLRIHATELSTPHSRAEVDANIGLAGNNPLDITAEFAAIDLAELRPLGGTDLGGVGRLKAHLYGEDGEFQIDGALDVRAFTLQDIPFADTLRAQIRCPRISRLELVNIEAARRLTRYTGAVTLDFEPTDAHPSPDLDVRLALGPARVNDLITMFLPTEGVDGALLGTVELHGPYDAFSGRADLDLTEVEIYGEHFSRGEARSRMEEGRFTLEHLILERQEGAETLLAQGTVGPAWAADLRVNSSGLRVETLDHRRQNPGSLRGAVALSSRIGGTLFVPEPHGVLRVTDTRLAGRRLQDTEVFFDSQGTLLRFIGGIAGSSLGVEGTLRLDAEGAWTLHADADDLPLHLFYPQAANGEPVTASLTGEATAHGALGRPDQPVDLRAQSRSVSVDFSGHALRSDGPWTWTQRGSAYEIEGVHLAGGDTDFSFGGRRTESGDLALQGGGVLDLDLLRAVVPGLERTRGAAVVELRVGGRPGALEPEVRVELTEALFKGDWFPEAFEDVEGGIIASPDGVTFQDMNGRLGGGAWSLAGGIRSDRWVPQRFDLSAELSGARVRYVDFLPPVVGDARLRFDGPAESLLLSGEITVHDMLFADRIDWEDWIFELQGGHLDNIAGEATADYFALDLAVVSNGGIRMRNNIGDFTGSADLRFVGDTSRPGLVGVVRAEPGGRVYLKERQFEIVRTELNFFDPYAYDPDLDISLNTAVRAREEAYDIDFRVSGPYSDWRAEASSNPSLPEADINALLVFGMTTAELERYGGLTGAIAAEGSDLLASRFGLAETVGEGVGTIFGVDVLRPERIDIVSGVNERGSGTISSEVRVLAEWDLGWSTTFIYEQNPVRPTDLYMGFEKRLARQLFLRSYWASEQIGRTLPIGGALGVETNIRWEIQ